MITRIGAPIYLMQWDEKVMDGNQLINNLKILGELLESRGLRYEVLAIGGGGLLLTGVISRPTIDLDVIAIRENQTFKIAEPFPEPLNQAIADVAGLNKELLSNWVNPGPAEAFRLGLPQDFEKRLTRFDFKSLIVFVAGRIELIGLKLHAWVDRYPGGEKHRADLGELNPTTDELEKASKWIRTHDVSQAFSDNVDAALLKLGKELNAEE